MNGLILIDKQTGMTSHDVVSLLRKKFDTKKIGHAGTLDPLATGLLLMGLGSGTRLLEYLVGMDKTYSTVAKLGVISDTLDIDGNVENTGVSEEAINKISKLDIQKVTDNYIGIIDQYPPKYSAIKINGKRAYEMARQGEDVKMSSRKVKINSIKNIVKEDLKFRMSVSCGSGTYIRSLVHDVGQDLGLGAVISELRRESIGMYEVSNAKKIDDVSIEDIVPVEKIETQLDKYECSDSDVKKLITGMSISLKKEYKNGEAVAVFCKNKLIAICHYKVDQYKLKPKKVFI